MAQDRLLNEIIYAAQDRRAADLVALNVFALTTMAEYFVIMSGTSSVHVKAIADAIEKRVLETEKMAVRHTEGYQGATWVLLDYGYIVVHIFMPEARQFYDLERLWRDAELVHIDTPKENP